MVTVRHARLPPIVEAIRLLYGRVMYHSAIVDIAAEYIEIVSVFLQVSLQHVDSVIPLDVFSVTQKGTMQL